MSFYLLESPIRGWSAVRDQGEFLQADDGSFSELELVSKLIIAATEFDGPMSVETIDRIIGI